MNILNNLKNNSLINSELEEFINNHFQEIYDFFYNQTQIDLYKHKQEIKQYLRQAKKQIISLDCSNKINGDFIALIIETCEKLHLFMEFKLFYEYLSKSTYTLGNRLESSHYYCNDIKKFEDYYDKYPVILDLLKRAYIEEEDSKEKLTATFINFYSTIIYDFGERNKQNVLKLKNAIFDKVKDSTYLDKEFINIIFNINISNFRKAYNDIIRILNDYLYRKDLISCQIDNYIKIEVSEYSKKLQEFDNPTFDKIFQVSKDYIENNIDDQDKIHYSLQRGTKILQTEEELYQYIKSFGKMHKAKLYSAFDTIIYMLKNQKINIIDWGCGQAFATFLLMDYIKEKKLNINVSNITLIEPSQIALSRGLLL
jgi:hypothetical protein